MIANILIGGAIFGYAGWAFYRFFGKARQGKCAACALQDNCSASCSTAQDNK
jgi:hypothetical protein